MSINIVKKIASFVIILAVVGGLCYCGYRVVNALMEKSALPTPKTIEEIANVSFDDIDHIETTKGTFEPTEFTRLFRANSYEAFTGDADFRQSETYRCYDSENNLLLTLKNYAKNSVIELNVGGEITLYQKYVPPAEDAGSNLLVK